MSELPYLGLRPYQEADQYNFYGRDADCEILVDKLLANRLTLLFAASGVGKSSLLNAAVLPRLKDPLGENLSVVYHNDWVQKPLALLHTAIREAVPAAKEAPAGQTLAELLSFCTLFTRHPFVIVLDQFEEFFRYQRGKADFDAVIQQLTALVINPDIPVSIVISMREDFALELNAFKPKLPTLLFENYYRLEKMKPEAARDAIVRPAEHFGYCYEPALLTRLVGDLSSHTRQQAQLPHVSDTKGDEYVEPAYLQIVCSHLWALNKDDSGKVIRLASYEKSGGSDGIVQRFLDNVQGGFSTAEKDLASKAFDYLAAQGGVKMAYPANVLAKILKVDESKLAKVLDKLASEKVRILRSQPREGVIWYELYHDMFSPSIERWNNGWKAKRLRRQRWITGSLITLLVAGLAFLVESFMWIQKNNFPADELFTQQKYRLMDWGFLPEPLPEMTEILPDLKGNEKMGELDKKWHEDRVGSRNVENFVIDAVDITIAKPFEMGQYEITYEQYDYYVWKQLKAGVTKVGKVDLIYPTGSTRENARGQRAVTQVSWNEAVAYTQWLTDRSDELNYRLPTEAEWEFAARAGTRSPYWWDEPYADGKILDKEVKANCDGCGSKWDNLMIAPVGSFYPNQFGLYDTAGNVWEWTCSEFKSSFEGQEQICDETASGSRVIRGGSWYDSSEWLRSSARDGFYTDNRSNNVGFRVIGLPRTN